MIETFLTIGLFLLVLSILIFVHEWGHYITAKLTGMRVDEFAIGFPPKIFSWKKGETEYSLNALPIGGFVRIHGEDPTQVTLDDPDQARTFSARPKWAQAIVLVAGVTMNVLFAWFLFVVILMIGVPTQVEEGMASPKAELVVMKVLQNSPAAAVIPPNAVITNIKTADRSLSTLTPSTVSDFIAQAGASEVEVTYTLNQEDLITVPVTPVTGLVETSPERPAVGISLALVETIRQPFLTALTDGFVRTIETTARIVVGLGSLLAGAFAGTADFSQVAGPVGIVGYVGDAAAIGFTSVLLFTAIISLNLAVINLLPVPALDGGRLVFVAIETMMRRPIPPVWAARVNFVGISLLLLLMLVATINDIGRLW